MEPADRPALSVPTRAFLVALTGVGIMSLTGCAGAPSAAPASTTLAAPATNQPTPPSPPAPLEDFPVGTITGFAAEGPDAAFISFEAQWLCEVQRQTFPHAVGLTDARAMLQAEHGIDDDGYQVFRQRLADDITLRIELSTVYRNGCQ